MLEFYRAMQMPKGATTKQVLRRCQKQIARSCRYTRDSREVRHNFFRTILQHHANKLGPRNG